MSEEDPSARAEADQTDPAESVAGDRPVRVIEFKRPQPEQSGPDNGEAYDKIALGALMVTLCGACSAAVLWTSRGSESIEASFVPIFGGGPILIGIILILRGIAERNRSGPPDER
ncbi:hypothetical protein [Phenylobacterium aquaticum]|uniref:hypothetical protein n=1 Tax=Phenylobacterium aquaticum TaxID=1763816 RepID=UPI001F5C1DDA|nr:hypothetical protein [Phenylobacterium aquaticum]MCI3135491.1 hypothetical protein [Phenylobacterium aquaticum]